MKPEVQIHLNKFVPRWYQIPMMDAIENKKYKRVLAILPRRAGKDMAAWNLCIRQCLKRVCIVYYILPTYSQARKIIWDSITIDGFRILDYIPKEVILATNSQEMKVRFQNGSLLQLCGSENWDNLMGTNPYGVVFSEYALQDERAWQYIKPILQANDGWALFISTPRGKQNHLYHLYEIAKISPDWFCYRLTLDDTQHVNAEDIKKEIESGEISPDMVQQEWYCSFDAGIEGAYYAKYLDSMYVKSQIGMVPWEVGFKVFSCWDIGVRDSTTIIMYQVIGGNVRIIDCYANNNEGLEHYVNVIQNKPYVWGKHIAPHDIKVREFGSGMTRWEKARQLGITFTIAPSLEVMDGIEAVRSTLSKTWIDEVKCAPLIKALMGYRKEYDSKKKIYKHHPLHDHNSHFADAMRYLAISLPRTSDGQSAETIERNYRQALYGEQSSMPAVFRDDPPFY